MTEWIQNKIHSHIYTYTHTHTHTAYKRLTSDLRHPTV